MEDLWQARDSREWLVCSALLLALVLSIACSDQPLVPLPDEPVAATGQDAPLVPADADALESYLRAGLERIGDPTADLFLEVANLLDVSMSPVPGARTVGAAVPFSTTNLQTAGVDESDSVKFDGQHLFVSHPALLETVWSSFDRVIAPGGPIASVRPASYYPEVEVIEPASVAIHLAESDPPRTEEVARIELPGGVQIHGLVLLEGEGTDPPLLTVIATQGGIAAYALDFADPWAGGEGQVHLWIYDVSDPEAPTELHRLRVEGVPLAVRRIGTRLTLVTRFSPFLRVLAQHAYDADERRRRVEAVTIEELLPRAWVDDADEEHARPIVSPENCFVPEDRVDADASYFQPTLVTITSIELRDPDDRVSVCAAGPVNRVFSSTRALYLASSVYGEQGETIVHKFRYLDDGPAFRGSGRVAGLPAGSQRDFGLGEHDDVFGIVTRVSGRTPEGQFESHHRLTLLREATTNAVNRLDEVAHLPNEREPAPIGKPGESLHAVRFVGPRVYAVTFRKIDPLYVIDIEDPRHPFIAGELVVPGFSDYLQPLGANLLLGVGKDTIADVNNDWFQGVKIELFDVSDPSRPRSADAAVIGRRGSETSARRDHQAVSVLDMGDGVYRVTVPIQVHEGAPEQGDPSDPWAYWQWSHTGLHLFEIDEDSVELTLRGVVPTPPIEDHEDIARPGTNGDRSRLQGEAVHYVHGGRISSASWNSPEEAVDP